MGIPFLSGQVQNPLKKQEKRGEEGERETEAGLLISTADDIGKFMLHTWFFNLLDCQTLTDSVVSQPQMPAWVFFSLCKKS